MPEEDFKSIKLDMTCDYILILFKLYVCSGLTLGVLRISYPRNAIYLSITTAIFGRQCTSRRAGF